jgi:hypothetical protein
VSRRPGSLFAFAFVILAACGGSRNDAPAPAAVKAGKPAAVKPEAPAATPSAAGEAAATPAAATTSAPAADAKLPAATTAASTEPPFTPGTSLPGAIPPSPLPADAKTDKAADPLQWMQDREARQADYKKRIAEAEAEVAVQNASIAEWERTILAFKNPFRPRPQLAPEDAQAIEGKDGIWRVSWAEGKRDAATAARDAAQKTLDDLKANPPSN